MIFTNISVDPTDIFILDYIMGHIVLENSVVQRTEECSTEPKHSDCPEDSPLCSDPYLFITKHKSILNTIYTT